MTRTHIALALCLAAAVGPLAVPARAADQEWLNRQLAQDRERQQAQAAYNAQMQRQAQANAQAAQARLQAEADAARARQARR